MIDPRRKLSPHFTLGEMVWTVHRTIDNTPPPEAIEQMVILCRNFLEPVRAQFGALSISSGYRCAPLNRLIKGSKYSAHLAGCAADFVCGDEVADVVAWVASSSLDYDQVIDERNAGGGGWVHLGLARPGAQPRREALTMRVVAGKRTYAPFRA